MIKRLITDQDIQAFVDGEFSEDDAKLVKHFIDRNKRIRRRYEDLLEQKRLLQEWWSKHKDH